MLLSFRNVVKEFPVTAGAVLQRKIGTVKAVSDVSFDVRRGETFGLVGESGCGKTTIGWLVTALHRPTSGEIRFGDQDMATLRGGDSAPGQTRLAADVPGPVRIARPAHARRPVDQRAARDPAGR